VFESVCVFDLALFPSRKILIFRIAVFILLLSSFLGEAVLLMGVLFGIP
jgi:hypothetical protein